MTPTEYANLIAKEYDCVFIPPVGCVVHMRFVHAPPNAPIETAEANVKITNIDISPKLTVTLTATDALDPTKSIFLIPEEITKILSVPDGTANPHSWWHRPR
jgi:hypothetical protein